MEHTERAKDPSSTPSALSVRYEMGLSYDRLRSSPEAQAEAIGRHYAAHALLAQEILKLIELRKYSDDSTIADAAIAYCVAQIKRNHRHDFGIDLEWVDVKLTGCDGG